MNFLFLNLISITYFLQQYSPKLNETIHRSLKSFQSSANAMKRRNVEDITFHSNRS